MAELFNYRYRVPSARAPWWNYGENGSYFITICTENRQHFFGMVKNKKMILTKIGDRAYNCWMEIPEHFPFVKLDAFVVMPNHVHGIIIIDKPKFMNTVHRNTGIMDGIVGDAMIGDAIVGDAIIGDAIVGDAIVGDAIVGDAIVGDAIIGDAIVGDAIVETQNFASLQPLAKPPDKTNGHFGPQTQNLASVIRGYKIGVTKYCKQNDLEFGWQSRYHDHIIRNQSEFERIAKYIRNNPANWKTDVHHR